MAEKCKELVQAPGMMLFHPCRAKYWKDGYCKIHHPESVAIRQEKSRQAYEASRARSPWVLLSKEKEAHETLRESVRRLVGEWETLSKDSMIHFQRKACFEQCAKELSALIDGKDGGK